MRRSIAHSDTSPGDSHDDRCLSYEDLTPVIDGACCVYCDPPYAGTTGYGVAFDTPKFWSTMRQWRERGAAVYVSEYAAPDDWTCVLEIGKHMSMRREGPCEARVERLFTSPVADCAAPRPARG
jgi:DNA adenine methylase